MDDMAAMHAYYALDKERDRLAHGVGRVEFERTVEVVSRTLPPPPATVADIGGGPGRYVDWLVEAGYTVMHRDVVPRHVDRVRDRHGPSVDTEVADACALDIAADTVDVGLLLGPLYHLPDAGDRQRALREARRVTRPGGLVHVAAITRWSARLHGVLVDRIHLEHPRLLDKVDRMETDGWMMPVTEGGFTGFAHTPQQLRQEILDAGLELRSLVGLEGISFAFADLDQRLDDPDEHRLLMDMIRAVESVPDLLGLGPHILGTASVPRDDDDHEADLS